MASLLGSFLSWIQSIFGLSTTSDMSATPSEFVTLVSSDGHQFILRREIANGAGAIKRMLDPNSTRTRRAVICPATRHADRESTGKFAEAQSGVCRFETIR